MLFGHVFADDFDEAIVVLEAAGVLFDVELVGDEGLPATLELKHQNTPAKFDTFKKRINKQWALKDS